MFFFWALWCLFIKHYDNECIKGWKELKSYFCYVRDNDHDSTKPLDPFDNDVDNDVENEVFEPSSIVEVYQHKEKNDISFFEKQDDHTNTPLQGERLCHYIALFAIALILLIITASLFLVAQYAGAREDVLDEESFKWESAAVVFHAYSLFRILVSCFIFSKLMYGIQRKCEELEIFVLYIDDHYNELLENSHMVYKFVENQFTNKINANSCDYIKNKIRNEKEKTLNNSKALALKYLDECDKHFVKQAVSTLSWLQLWFLLHWLLHILSTFMTIALFVDAIALRVRAEVPHKQGGFAFHPVEIGFLFMYSLLQCFFLFYPCLRAASVTRTRQRVIDKISENIRSFENIDSDEVHVAKEFIESMKRRRFSF